MAIDPAISVALGFSLGLLFAASAAHKALGLREFEGVLRNYRVLPSIAVPAAVISIIAFEAATALLVLLPSTRAAGALAAAAILLVYAAAIAVNIMRGRTEIDCGCSFGTPADRLSSGLLARNGVLIAAALVAAAPAAQRPLTAPDFMAIALFVPTAAAFYLSFEAIRANAARFHFAGHAR